MVERMRGVIISVWYSKGYAFLRDQDGHSRFIFARTVQPISDFDELHEGMVVEFTPVGELNCDAGAKNNGLRAEMVILCR